MPISGTSWLSGAIKGLLFFLITLILLLDYLQNDQSGWSYSEDEDSEESAEQAKELLSEDAFAKAEGVSPTEGFQWFYKEYLSLLRASMVASCVGLYLKKQDSLILLGGDADEGYAGGSVVVPEGDLLETVGRQREPILEGNLPFGMHLSGYEGSQIRSFLGVPLLWGDKLAGVLAFGSQATESFSDEDKQFALRSGRLLTHAMALFYMGIHWESSDSVSRIHIQLEKQLRMIDDMNQAAVFFADAIRSLFPFERFTLCERDGEEGVVRAVVGQIDDVDRGYRFPLNDGINGWVMKRRAPLLLDDMKSGDFKRPRYSKSENPKHGMRSFLGIPIGHGEVAWGCICLEHSMANKYQEKNKEMLYTLSFALEATLERLSGARRKGAGHTGDMGADQYTLEI